MKRARLIDSQEMFPARLAHILARELGLSPGNMWELGACLSIRKHLAAGVSERKIATALRFSLGLAQAKGKGGTQ